MCILFFLSQKVSMVAYKSMIWVGLPCVGHNLKSSVNLVVVVDDRYHYDSVLFYNWNFILVLLLKYLKKFLSYLAILLWPILVLVKHIFWYYLFGGCKEVFKDVYVCIGNIYSNWTPITIFFKFRLSIWFFEVWFLNILTFKYSGLCIY